MDSNRTFTAEVYEPSGSRFNVRIVKTMQAPNGSAVYFDREGRTFRARTGGGLGLEAFDLTALDPEG